MTLSSSPRDCTDSPSLHGFNWFQTSHFASITYGLRAQEVADMFPEGWSLYSVSQRWCSTCLQDCCFFFFFFNAPIGLCGMLSVLSLYSREYRIVGDSKQVHIGVMGSCCFCACIQGLFTIPLGSYLCTQLYIKGLSVTG